MARRLGGANRPRRLGGSRLSEAISGYLFILPNFAGFIVFAVGPIAASFVLAFTRWDLFTPPVLIGAKNFVAMFRSPDFLISMRQTLLFTVVNVPVQTAIALAAALFLNRKTQGINLLRTLFLLPWATMPLANTLTFQWMFNTDYGVFNHLLGYLGIAKVAWLSRPTMAFLGILTLNVWIFTGFHIIVLLSALQNVPVSLLEAAQIDGADARRRFLSITLPSISPILFYDMVVNLIGTLQVFDIAYVFNNGGPGRTTFFYNFMLYRTAFTYQDYSKACAMGLFQFVLIALFALLAFRVAGRRVTYGQV